MIRYFRINRIKQAPTTESRDSENKKHKAKKIKLSMPPNIDMNEI